MSRGVLYIATGERFVDQARRSAESVKAVRPDLPITLCTDVQDPDGPFDTHLVIEDPAYDVSDKCGNIHRTPYDRTVYLDVDTYVCHGSFFDDVFAVLDQVELAATLDVGRHVRLMYYGSYDSYPAVDAPDAFAWLNMGFLAFRDTDPVAGLFDDWVATYNRHQRRAARMGLDTETNAPMDQPAFREALFGSDVRYGVLPLEYNCRIRYGHYLIGEAKMLHGWVTNHEEIARRINETTAPRVFRTTTVHGEGVVRVQRQNPGGIKRKLRVLWIAVRRHGLSDTIQRIARWLRGGSFNRRPFDGEE